MDLRGSQLIENTFQEAYSNLFPIHTGRLQAGTLISEIFRRKIFPKPSPNLKFRKLQKAAPAARADKTTKAARRPAFRGGMGV